MNKMTVVFGLLWCVTVCAQELDYHIDNGRFVTSQGAIPSGCFGQLMTELNGDNSIATIFVNRASLRGCIDANYPYPGGVDDEITYSIEQNLGDHKYKLRVCQVVDGSMGSTCDSILVRFLNRDYMLKGATIKVLSLEKFGEW